MHLKIGFQDLRNMENSINMFFDFFEILMHELMLTPESSGMSISTYIRFSKKSKSTFFKFSMAFYLQEPIFRCLAHLHEFLYDFC